MPDSTPAERVARLLERIARQLQKRARGDDLNPAQWEALRYIARANRFSRSPSATASFLAATKGTVSQTLLSLERKGLVNKRRSEADGRGTLLDVSASGHALLKAADPASDLAAVVDALPPLHVSIISQTLTRVLEALVAEHNGRSFGACVTCRHFQHQTAVGQADGPHECGLFSARLTDQEAQMICARHKAA